MGLSRAWIGLNFLLPAAIFLTVFLGVPAWIWLVCGLGMALIYLPTFWTRVPYYLSDEAAIDALEKIFPPGGSFRFVDVGCGNGRVLAKLAKRFPQSRYDGWEISPWAYVLALWNTRACRKQVCIRFVNFWKQSFSDYDIVYAFLAPQVMETLYQKVQKDMGSKAFLISNTFVVPGIESTEDVALNSEKQDFLHIYRGEASFGKTL